MDKVLCAVTNIYINEGHFCISYNPNNNLKGNKAIDNKCVHKGFDLQI